MIVRKFNGKGIAAFRGYLANWRENPELAVPRQMLEDDELTDGLSTSLEVAAQKFVSKADAATYLSQLLGALPEQSVAENDGLWTWLTLFFFEEVCPSENGRRVVKNDYHYVFEHRNSRHFYRHLLFIPWRVKCIARNHDRLILSSPLKTLDKVTTEIMKRLFLTRIPCMFEVLDRLYWDASKGAPRRGIASPGTIKPGDLYHRLPAKVRQLEKTYDLHSLNANQLIDLLGNEFRQVRNGRGR